MPWSDALLAACARALYKRHTVHDAAMKATQFDAQAFNAYRATVVDRVLERLRETGESVAGKRVLDLGCDTGSLSVGYAQAGAASVIGVDVNAKAIAQAEQRHTNDRVSFRVSDPERLPLEDASVDLILSYDVFEHVVNPPALLKECRRVLAPGGALLIGTWGWGHPYAPHLWATMPVPWAHLIVSETTLLRACRRVYEAPWYRPTRHDFDEQGQRRPNKYLDREISGTYLNHYTVRDFERAFTSSGLQWRVELKPFSVAPWTAPLLRTPLREYLHGYLWAFLRKA